MVLLYSGTLVCFSPVLGLIHSIEPSERAAKLATVMGALSAKSSSVMSPRLVFIMADLAFFSRLRVGMLDCCLVGNGVGSDLVVEAGVWVQADRKIAENKTRAKRRIGRFYHVCYDVLN